MMRFEVELLTTETGHRYALLISNRDLDCHITLQLDDRAMYQIESAMIDLQAECEERQKIKEQASLKKCRCGNVFCIDDNKKALFFDPQFSYLCLECQVKRQSLRLS